MTTLKSVALAATFLLPTAALADWTGGYAGLSFGLNTTNEISDSDFTIEADDNGTFGLYGGYMAQNGNLVFGGEVAFSSTEVEVEIEGEEITGDYDIFDLKGRAGFATGTLLPYAVVGYTNINSEGDDASGFNFGVGLDYEINANFVIGGEFLARRTAFDGDGGDLDVNVDTLSIRGSYKF